MTRLSIVFAATAALAACGSRHEPAPSRPAVATAAPTAATVPDASSTADPPEPQRPLMDCDLAPQVTCVAGMAATRAFEPPFETCAPTLAGTSNANGMQLGSSGRQFSAVETRKARASTPGTCCYLEWTWSACD